MICSTVVPVGAEGSSAPKPLAEFDCAAQGAAAAETTITMARVSNLRNIWPEVPTVLDGRPVKKVLQPRRRSTIAAQIRRPGMTALHLPPMRLLAALLLAALTLPLAAQQAASQKRPMTFADLMAMKRVADPQVSPSGKWV